MRCILRDRQVCAWRSNESRVKAAGRVANEVNGTTVGSGRLRNELCELCGAATDGRGGHHVDRVREHVPPSGAELGFERLREMPKVLKRDEAAKAKHAGREVDAVHNDAEFDLYRE